MALEGSLKDFGLADIFQLIYFQKKTGILALDGKLDRIRLSFIEGNITGAESRRRIESNRLGKVLVKKGLLEEQTLQAILEEQSSSNVKLGNILIKKGLVDKEKIQEILRGQIQETVVQLFSWKQGAYEFTPQAVPTDKELPISLDTQHLLMEGLRIVDEWTDVEGKITLDTVFRKKTEESVPVLTEEENEILSFIDGENDVSTIVDLSEKDDFEVSKILVRLMEKGVVEKKEVAPVLTEVPPVEAKKATFPYGFLIVIAIVLSLFLSLFPLLRSSANIFKQFTASFIASRDINALRLKIEAYKFQHGAYPENIDLISKNLDPWGNPYIYKQDEYTFMVISRGADGKEGTSDDIY
ncbi:MAG: DUF4388 domain-containing protein [Nitrospirota bacterium]